jgi:hypothetical protein
MKFPGHRRFKNAGPATCTIFVNFRDGFFQFDETNGDFYQMIWQKIVNANSLLDDLCPYLWAFWTQVHKALIHQSIQIFIIIIIALTFDLTLIFICIWCDVHIRYDHEKRKGGFTAWILQGLVIMSFSNNWSEMMMISI